MTTVQNVESLRFPMMACGLASRFVGIFLAINGILTLGLPGDVCKACLWKPAETGTFRYHQMIHTFCIKQRCIFGFCKARHLTKSLHVPRGPMVKLRILFAFDRTSFSGLHGDDRFNFLPLDWLENPTSFLWIADRGEDFCGARLPVSVASSDHPGACRCDHFDHYQVISSDIKCSF